jgi:hypothetical protein
MRQVYLILPLFLAVFISGCVIPGGSTGGAGGVDIMAFETDWDQVYIDEPVSFRVLVQNTGSVDSGDGSIDILGLEEWSKLECSPSLTFDRLLPPNPDRGTSGESFAVTCNSDAPEVPSGLSVTYTPTARMSYGYSSDFVKSIIVASQEELRAIESRGTGLPSELISSSTSPISLSIETKGPIRFWSDTSKVEFPLEITVNNVGGGIACLDSSCDTNDWNKIRLTIDGVDLDDSECQKYSSKGVLTLWQGRSNTIVCKASFSVGGIVGAVQKNIQIHADYGYFVDRTIPITVNWRETS